jgi:hypothetical protein
MLLRLPLGDQVISMWHNMQLLPEQTIWRIQAPARLRRWQKELASIAPPVFVGGTGGSGTRVVAQLLEACGLFMGSSLNPEYDSLPTVIHYSNYWSRRTRRLFAGDQRAGRRADRDLQLALAAHREGMPDPASAWGAKNPRFVILLPHLHRLFPRAFFVHVLRDGRDMAFSRNHYQLEQVGARYLPDLAGRLRVAPMPLRQIALWARINLDAAAYGQAQLGARYLPVHFERLCCDPVSETARIAGQIGLSPAGAEQFAQELRIPPTSGRWRSAPAELITELEREAAQALQTFGYVDG